jgi:hypothetical protein
MKDVMIDFLVDREDDIFHWIEGQIREYFPQLEDKIKTNYPSATFRDSIEWAFMCSMVVDKELAKTLQIGDTILGDALSFSWGVDEEMADNLLDLAAELCFFFVRRRYINKEQMCLSFYVCHDEDDWTFYRKLFPTMADII